MQFISPAPEDVGALAKILDFLQPHSTVHLTSAHDQVALTGQLRDILVQVARALSQGESIRVLALEEEISTQQAAEILGLSRPTVVRLIDAGDLKASIPGRNRRRLSLSDVLAYREELYDERNRYIAESSAEFGDIDEAEVADLLSEARSRT